MKTSPLVALLPDKFEPYAQFWDVEGIPVSWAAVKGLLVSIAWDTNPPRPFDSSSAYRNGAPIEEAEFRAMVAAQEVS